MHPAAPTAKLGRTRVISKSAAICVIAALLILSAGCAQHGVAGSSGVPETVLINNGPITLHGLLYRPEGTGPFPAVLLNHGSGRTREALRRLGPYENQAEVLGPVFARHGYVLLFPFRQGVGLSADQGTSAIDLMDEGLAAHGPDERNRIQLELLEHRELGDAEAALAFLRARREVDARNLALVGHSFGGSLTILQAERERNLRAVVVFSSTGYSWDRSPALRERLLGALERVDAPVFFIHAANDYSLNPGKELDARLAQLAKPHRLRIYPPIGRTPDDGHDFPLNGVSIWESDVFAFLDGRLQR